MSVSPLPRPSDFELQILALLWERGPMTAREVRENLPDKKPRAYTSVLSVMQVMEKKGLLAHTAQGKTHLYRPRVAKTRILRGLISKLVHLVFGGKPAAAVQALLDDKTISPQELSEIRKMLDAKSPRK
ncbi:MAG: BlaI/MecI/CopY family transcriptional regulator [Phycisphaerales bacterium]|nr:BlaI/MecI/CopY family transcriptional regulator [Phycisphaerales bacterium]